MSMENEETDNIIILNDEDGNEVRFEFLDIIEYDGNEYVALMPSDEDSDEDLDEDTGEVVILKVEDEQNEDEESYVGVEDDEELNAVFQIFKDKYKNDFNFID